MSDELSFGYLEINEVHPPREMIKLAVIAEKYGWDTLWLSDHFHPWSHAGTNCNFCWTVLATAAERTKKVKLGPGVTVPGQRYHPAIIAQAFATLGAMYPDRIVLGLGSGEPINEVAVGSDWPSAGERLRRFDEALKVIRLLFDGDFVSFNGKYFKTSTARLYTKPPKPVPLYVSTTGPKSAEIAGRYADGIIVPTGSEAPEELLKENILPAMRRGAKEVGRDPDAIKIVVHVSVSYDEDLQKALHSFQREYWNHTVIPKLFESPVSDPRINQEKGKSVDDETFLTHWIVETTPEAHIKRLEPFIKLGIDELMILSTSPSEEKFLKVFGTKVLPHLRDL